jgi:inosose dehydratase
MSRLGRALQDEFAVSTDFHPHVDSQVDTQPRIEHFPQDTDAVWLCLDTGHVSYCDGDNIEIIRRLPDRIGYVHLKHVDPDAVRGARQEKLSFADAVKLGAMVEPRTGIPAMEPLLAELTKPDVDLFAIVEQDLYRCDPDFPLPVATGTRRYLNTCGLGPAPRP